MNSPARAKPELLEALERLAPHDHLCLVYETQQEQFAAVIPYIRIGLERGEKCVYIADDNSVAAVLEAMRAEGIDVDSALQSGALSVSTKQETYLKQGHFDPDSMIRSLKEATDSAIAAGFAALRVTGEMTWAMGRDPGAERLMEYESKLNYFYPANKCLGICQYNRRRFSPEIILGVVRIHPIVVYGEAVCRNFSYVPPAELLKPDQTAREIERFLTYIQDRQRVEDALRKAHASVLTAQEAERRWVSRELHDDLNQKLAMLAVDVEALEQQLPLPPELIRDRLEAIRSRVVEVSNQLSRIAHQLHPSILEHLGLTVALKSYCAEFSKREGIKVEVRHRSLPDRLPQDVALCLYRVTQEGLRNIARHSRSPRATVMLAGTSDGVRLSIEDFGIGFDPESAKSTEGLGLISMEERVRLVSGSLSLRSRPGEGARIDVRVPLSVSRQERQGPAKLAKRTSGNKG
jgi:signal transduction histidine kinase